MPNPDWPFQFECEAARITEMLGGAMVGFTNIGSTSVPGVFAKPVIDILLEAATSEVLERISAGMERLGAAHVFQ
jgi:GrpB-like predicted nucleotidyltransferase (UPF0157 family)